MDSKIAFEISVFGFVMALGMSSIVVTVISTMKELRKITLALDELCVTHMQLNHTLLTFSQAVCGLAKQAANDTTAVPPSPQA